MKNQITLVGNIGKAPQITNFENGNKVARFDIATNSSNSNAKKPEWHHVFAFGNIAQFIENFAETGKRIAISGKLVNRTYVNKMGQPRKITEVEILHVIGL